jgi:hypothetical protein
MAFEVKPKNGWAEATDDEVFKEFCNMVGTKYCFRPEKVHEILSKLNLNWKDYAPKIMNQVNDEFSNAMFVAIMQDNNEPLKNILQ